MPRLEPEIIAKRMEAMRKHRAEVIAGGRWMVQGVFGTEENPLLWNYTIGMLDKFGFELLMFGLRMEFAAQVMNDLGDDWLNRKVRLPQLGVPFSASRWFQGDVWLMYRKCKPTPELYANWMAQATDYHGRVGFDVYQIVLADKHGKFPSEVGFDHAAMDRVQPILYQE